MLNPPIDPLPARQIEAALEVAGLRVDPQAQCQLARWLGALLAQQRNLTALTEPSAAAAKHIVEPIAGFAALLGADAAVPHGALIDVGSGNGAPGLPIALAYGAPALTVLDSRRAAADFLRTLPELLGAPWISVHHGRAERAGALRGRFAAAVTRAAAPPRIALELCMPLLALGGTMLAFARPPSGAGGPHGLGELERTAAALGARLMPLPAGLELIAAVKVRPTPSGYPRPWARIKREPIAPP